MYSPTCAHLVAMNGLKAAPAPRKATTTVRLCSPGVRLPNTSLKGAVLRFKPAVVHRCKTLLI